MLSVSVSLNCSEWVFLPSSRVKMRGRSPGFSLRHFSPLTLMLTLYRAISINLQQIKTLCGSQVQDWHLLPPWRHTQADPQTTRPSADLHQNNGKKQNHQEWTPLKPSLCFFSYCVKVDCVVALFLSKTYVDICLQHRSVQVTWCFTFHWAFPMKLWMHVVIFYDIITYIFA